MYPHVDLWFVLTELICHFTSSQRWREGGEAKRGKEEREEQKVQLFC